MLLSGAIVMAYIVMAYIVMAYIVMACGSMLLSGAMLAGIAPTHAHTRGARARSHSEEKLRKLKERREVKAMEKLERERFRHL